MVRRAISSAHWFDRRRQHRLEREVRLPAAVVNRPNVDSIKRWNAWPVGRRLPSGLTNARAFAASTLNQTAMGRPNLHHLTHDGGCLVGVIGVLADFVGDDRQAFCAFRYATTSPKAWVSAMYQWKFT